MRSVLVEWGRRRWPDARVFHELKIEPCRIDLAFITTTNLIGIEIKSSKDTLDRLGKQIEVFTTHIPTLYIAYHPKWSAQIGYHRKLEVLLEDDATLKAGVYERGWPRSEPNWRCYVHMLDLLWAEEARAICGRHLMLGDKRQTLGVSLPRLAAKLTGEQIVAEVCHELRGRPTANEADPPVYPAALVPADGMPLEALPRCDAIVAGNPPMVRDPKSLATQAFDIADALSAEYARRGADPIERSREPARGR